MMKLYRGTGKQAHSRIFEDDAFGELAIQNGWSTEPSPDAEEPDPVVAEPVNPHAANASEVKEYVSATDDLAALEGLKASEENHPAFEGGRVGVLKAINDKIDALKA